MKRLVAALSLFLFSFLIFGYLWWGKFQYSHSILLVVSYLGAFGLVVFSHIYFRDHPKSLGLRLDNLGPAFRLFGIFTLMCAFGIILAGLLWGDVRLHRWSDLYGYFLWAGVQQYLLQNFLRTRSKDLMGLEEGLESVEDFRPHILTATLFAAYHLPHPFLVLGTFILGLCWCWLFARTPSYPAAWASQAVLGALVILFFKHGLLGQLHVGYPGFRYEAYGEGVLVSAGYDSRGRPFVATLPGADAGVPSKVRIFTPEGTLLQEWIAFEGLDFSGQISVGDLGFGPGDEIAVSPGPSPDNLPQVKVFDPEGQLFSDFSPQLGHQGYGARVSIGEGKLYLSPGPGPGYQPRLLEYSPQGELLRFWSFEWTGFENGMVSAILCPDRSPDSSDSQPETTLAVWASGIPVNSSDLFFFKPDTGARQLIATFPTTYGLQATPICGSESAVAVAPGPLKGYPPWVKLFDFEGEETASFVPFDSRQAYGTNLAAVDVNGDRVEELVLGEGIGSHQSTEVRIVDLKGQVLHKWEAY